MSEPVGQRREGRAAFSARQQPAGWAERLGFQSAASAAPPGAADASGSGGSHGPAVPAPAPAPAPPPNSWATPAARAGSSSAPATAPVAGPAAASTAGQPSEQTGPPAAGRGGDAGSAISQMIPVPLRVGSELAARLLVIAAAMAVVVFLIIQLRVVVIPVVIALLLAALLAPVVRTAVEAGVPRGPATGIVLVGGIALFGIVISGVVNAFVAGLPELRDQLIQSYQETIKPLLAGPPFRISLERLNNLPGELQHSIAANSQAITSGALSTAATLTEVLSGMLLGLFVLIFFLHDGSKIWGFLIKVVPREQRARVDTAGERAFASLVGYTRATVVVAVVDAIGIGIGLWIIGTPLRIPLAALVFLGAFIPVVGSLLSGSVAVLVTLVANGPVQALVVFGIVIVVMQVESHVLQPILMGRAVQLHPLAVVLAVAGGVVIAGITGALVAVPLVAVLTSGIRSLLATSEAHASQIDSLDPLHAGAGGAEPQERRRLRRLAARVKELFARLASKAGPTPKTSSAPKTGDDTRSAARAETGAETGTETGADPEPDADKREAMRAQEAAKREGENAASVDGPAETGAKSET
ncbi:MAG TPA: AI-2E family transporter [Pseudonocardia sp.]|nr:AI-2E family transporter [Pseudonocardia sp.]